MDDLRIHALLIGIDSYTDGPRPLFGCCNDINAMQTVLTGSLGVPRERVTRLASSHDETADFDGVSGRPATRKNIVEALRKLGEGTLGPADRVLIYYSGHGGSVELPGERGATLRESLVPVDVMIEATREVHNIILDIELIALLRGITARTPQVTLILDACHSAGATRGAFRGQPGDRPRNADLRGFVKPGAPVQSGDRGGILRGLAGSLETCVVAAACQADELANEGMQDNGPGGHFTAALLRSLAELDRAELPELRWGQIWRQILARVEARANQHPQLLGSFARKVFGGLPEHGDSGFGVKREGAGYRLPVGELAGVTKGALVGVYGGLPVVLPPRGSAEEQQVRIGTLRVVDARRGSSAAELADGTAHEQLISAARAQLLRPGAPSLSVAFDPPSLLDAPLRQAIAASPFVRLADAGEPASLVVKQRHDGQLALTDDLHGTGDGDDVPYLFRFPADTPREIIRALLEHYGAYIAPVEFARRCEDPPVNLLRLNLLDCTQLPSDERGYVTSPGFDPQDPQLPRIEPDHTGQCNITAERTLFCTEVQNPGTRTLHVTLIECGASGRVFVRGTAAIKARARHVFWCDNSPGCGFQVGLPEGRSGLIDRLVAIGTTASGVDLRYLGTEFSFAAVLRGDNCRDGGGRYPPKELWTSAQLVVRSHRP